MTTSRSEQGVYRHGNEAGANRLHLIKPRLLSKPAPTRAGFLRVLRDANLAAGRSTYVYRVALAGLPGASAPDLKNKSFAVSAKVEIGDKANGMIFAQGGNTGGWAFYIGSDTGTPVTYDYQTPFEFGGKLEEVVVELKR
jgi:hypothetical protein